MTPPFFPSRSPMLLETAKPPGQTLNGPTPRLSPLGPSSNSVGRTSPPLSIIRFLSPSEQSNRCSLLNLDVPFLFGTSKIASESPTAAVVTFLPFTMTTVAVHPECMSFRKNFSSRFSNANFNACGRRYSNTSSGFCRAGGGERSKKRSAKMHAQSAQTETKTTTRKARDRSARDNESTFARAKRKEEEKRERASHLVRFHHFLLLLFLQLCF